MIQHLIDPVQSIVTIVNHCKVVMAFGGPMITLLTWHRCGGAPLSPWGTPGLFPGPENAVEAKDLQHRREGFGILQP